MSKTPRAIWEARRAPEIVVVTGESGAGKTRWCEALRAFAESQSLRAAGLISYGVFEGTEKVAIELCALPSGERRRLAERRAYLAGDATPLWAFDQAALAWGDAHLAQLTACDVLIVDELGPLELLHGRGWQSAFAVLAAGRYQMACVVVRPTLLEQFAARCRVGRVVRL